MSGILEGVVKLKGGLLTACKDWLYFCTQFSFEVSWHYTSCSVAFRVRTKMNTCYIGQLKLFTPAPPIKLKILRLWRSISPLQPDTLLSLDFLAVDTQGDVVQCKIKEFDAPIFEKKLKEGCAYIIDKFDVKPPKPAYNVIASQFIIQFTRTTSVREVTDDPAQYPLYHFNFAEYQQLHDRVYQVGVLSDIIGVVISMSSITIVQLNNTAEDVEKRDIELQNANGQTVTFTLFGNATKLIDVADIQDKIVNPVMVAAGVMIKTYQGKLYAASCSATKVYLDIDIPETSQLKQRYQNEPTIFRYIQLEDRQQQAPMEPPRSATIAELQNLDPATHRANKFNLTAVIADVRTPFGWHYNAFNECTVKLEPHKDAFYCGQHGKKNPVLTYRFNLTLADPTGEIDVVIFGKQAERLIGASIPALLTNTDSKAHVIPPAIQQLKGETRTFQVGLTAWSIDTNIVKLKVYNCDDHRSNKRKANHFEPASQLSLELPSHGSLSPTATEASKEIFPEETPLKKSHYRGKEATTSAPSQAPSQPAPATLDDQNQHKQSSISNPANATVQSFAATSTIQTARQLFPEEKSPGGMTPKEKTPDASQP